MVGRLLISLPFTYITVVLADLFKNKYHKLNNKKYFVLFIVSLLLSILTSNIWNQETNNNYIAVTKDFLRFFTVDELKEIDLKPANIKELLINGKYLVGLSHLVKE